MQWSQMQVTGLKKWFMAHAGQLQPWHEAQITFNTSRRCMASEAVWIRASG